MSDDEAVSDRLEPVWAVLNAVEAHLDEITERLDELKADLATVVDLVRERWHGCDG
jgi:hypothetical protein